MALGYTVEELLDRISSEEVTEWMVYFSKNPFGDDRADYRIGQLSALTANLKRGKDQKAFTPYDFMPFTKQPKRDNKSLIESIKRTFK